jgi:hypothetical protein
MLVRDNCDAVDLRSRRLLLEKATGAGFPDDELGVPGMNGDAGKQPGERVLTPPEVIAMVSPGSRMTFGRAMQRRRISR